MKLNMAQLVTAVGDVAWVGMPIVPSVDAPVADVDVEELIPDAANCKNYICVLYGKHRIVSSASQYRVH